MRIRLIFFLVLALVIPNTDGNGQTVFMLFKTDMKRADQYFEEGNFRGALALYQPAAKKHPSPETYLKIARCNYFLKQYTEAIGAYDEYMRLNFATAEGADHSVTDTYYYAEAQSAVSNYPTAIHYYKQLLASAPNDQEIIRKIWRLTNIEFLYEDSLYFAVRSIQINTEYGELCPIPYKDGLVFLSNRKEVQLVDKTDASLNAPFYRLYFSKNLPDTTSGSALHFAKPVIFNNGFNSRFHAGPIRFYDHGKKMVLATSGEGEGEDGRRYLQIYFGALEGSAWKITSSFQHNNLNHSLTDPAVNADGSILYFSSDMKGGFGGKDLYQSEFINGQWTIPTNLGEVINTAKDEVFPYLHQDKMLYFSSNGHAGMGGLDIFKAEIGPEGFGEPQNAGYPLNTNYDEFGIVIDSLNRHGYLTSNRKSGGYNDDIYEFDQDLQTYPLEINALLRIKEFSWSDSSSLKSMPLVRVYLVDNVRNIIVYETHSDVKGNFRIIVPYSSKYKIKVITEENEEHFVSLEISKHQQIHGGHEIVIVKDTFRPPPNPVVK